MFGRTVRNATSEPFENPDRNPSPDPRPRADVRLAAKSFVFTPRGDYTVVVRPGSTPLPWEPMADVHASDLLQWLTLMPCNGKWVAANDISDVLYRSFVAFTATDLGRYRRCSSI